MDKSFRHHPTEHARAGPVHHDRVNLFENHQKPSIKVTKYLNTKHCYNHSFNESFDFANWHFLEPLLLCASLVNIQRLGAAKTDQHRESSCRLDAAGDLRIININMMCIVLEHGVVW